MASVLRPKKSPGDFHREASKQPITAEGRADFHRPAFFLQHYFINNITSMHIEADDNSAQQHISSGAGVHSSEPPTCGLTSLMCLSSQ